MGLFDIRNARFWPSSEGMKSLHQDLKNQNCQSKCVVIGGAIDAAEVDSLQVCRGVLGHTDEATVDYTCAVCDLHGVTIDNGNQCIVIEQCILEVHISKDIPFAVNCIDCNGEIAGSAVEMAMIEVAVLFGTLLGLQEIVQVIGFFEFGHDIAHKLFAGVQHFHRPCNRHMVE